MSDSIGARIIEYLRYCFIKPIMILIGVQACIFIVCYILDQDFMISAYLDCRASFWNGEIWRPLTAVFTHATLGHFFFSMLGLFLMGRWMLETLSIKRFFVILFVGATLANFLHLCISDKPSLGFHGAFYCLLVAATIRQPKALIFFFPAWLFVSFFVFIDVINFLNSLRPGQDNGIAYDVNVFAAAIGALFMWGQPLLQRYKHNWNIRRNIKSEIDHAQELNRVDHLLEKISKEGLHTLTDEERKFLQRHSKNERTRQN